MTRAIRIRGRFEHASAAPSTADLGLIPRGQLRPAAARDGAEVREFAADDLVRVSFDNDLVLWLRADDVALDYGRREAQRGAGADVWEIAGPRVRGGDRGLLRVGVRLLEFFGLDLKGKAAAALGAKGELKQLGDRVGLFRVPLDAPLAFAPVAAGSLRADAGPLLVFVHGTASSMPGSFGGLWSSAPGAEARRALLAQYGERVFAWEHRTLTQTPIQNALELAQALPTGAEVHLVTHSRGGLVGELLCLGSRDDAGVFEQPLEAAGRPLVETLFAPDPVMGIELGLPRLDGDDARAQAAVRAQQLAAFRELLQVLDARRLSIARFVRVACPARGTTLASGRLDRWLSVLNLLLERTALNAATAGVAADLVDFVLAVVKQRTDPRTLPGLEAMMPASPVVRLLNLPQLQLRADLSVIAGDVQGDSIWSRLKLVVTDWFYGSEHDLVVNTPSMLGGARRPAGGARFERDQGAAVTHFNYFGNDKTVRLLTAGLMRRGDGLGGFRPMEDAAAALPETTQAIARSAVASGPRPLVLMLPGTMGSGLRVGGDEIWLHHARLLMGRLGHIEYGRSAEPFKLLDAFYGPLVEHLRHSHRVETFPYDWRQSVRETARQLSDRVAALLPACERSGQPLRLLAHSMGGLVVRAFIALFPALWARVQALPGSRFVMLGTPNRGSLEAMRWLTGLNPTQVKLTLLDLTRSRDGLIDLVRRFPGLLELLPSADAEGFADAALWKRLKSALAESWPLAEAAQLRAARETWTLIESSPVDPQRMIYVAGCADQTVVGYEVVDGRRGGKMLSFRATREGDGTVPWSSGRLDGVATWYVRDTAHDALCVQARAFAGYVDLLQTGTTTRLASAPPVSRAAGEPATFVLSPRPPADSIPGEADVLRLGFGGSLPGPSMAEEAPAAPLRVSIRHGDLAYARHPVMVGHYLGDSIVGAEKALDRRLGGKLSREQGLGLYPGATGTHAVFLQADGRAAPPGALVLGLGQVGALSGGSLERGARQAMLAYALAVADCPDDRFGPAAAARSARLSCLLVATGAGGLPLRDSIDALLRAALAANRHLQASGLAHRVLIDELEFVELMEDVAIGAAHCLERVLADESLRHAVDWRNRVVEAGEGGWRRARFDEPGEWWQRMEIAHDARLQVMRFIPLTDRARAEEHVVAGQLRLADPFIRRASQHTGRDADAARTLFEMLLPQRLKEMAPEQRSLVLLLDGVSARYPWELLENRWSVGARPPAVAAGMLRQLRTPVFRAQPAHPARATALVVGNPRLGSGGAFADLPGAEAEARTVAAVLRRHGHTVSESIAQPAEHVLGALHGDGWRILHLAGHGVHEQLVGTGDAATRVSGMVIGEDMFLTPGDVAQVRHVPELVFLNCCYLGAASGARPAQHAELASNLALQFIEMGVRAVVAAGWAVNDEAARVFAETLYETLLDGESFGEAVRAARETIWDRFPDVNTWGAYQCYGEPGFRLQAGSAVDARAPAPDYRAPAELVADLDNLRGSVRMQTRDASSCAVEGPAIGTRIDALLQRIPPGQDWTARADVAAALGFAHGEFEDYAQAIAWFDRALAARDGDCPVRVIEQRANMVVRGAAQRWHDLRTAPDAAAWRDEALQLADRIEGAIRSLEQLGEYGQTAERLNLLGSACKRLAWIREDVDPRIEAIANMAQYYARACEQEELGGTPGTYASFNWLMAELVRRWWQPRARLGAARERAMRQACEAALARCRQKNAADPDFWSGSGEADGELVLALMDGRVDAPTAERLSAAYARALARGASPRERASLVDNLDFLARMCEGRPRVAALAAGLHRIRAAL